MVTDTIVNTRKRVDALGTASLNNSALMRSKALLVVIQADIVHTLVDLTIHIFHPCPGILTLTERDMTIPLLRSSMAIPP
jgi:hypothetical protein